MASKHFQHVSSWARSQTRVCAHSQCAAPGPSWVEFLSGILPCPSRRVWEQQEWLWFKGVFIPYQKESTTEQKFIHISVLLAGGSQHKPQHWAVVEIIPAWSAEPRAPTAASSALISAIPPGWFELGCAQLCPGSAELRGIITAHI